MDLSDERDHAGDLRRIQPGHHFVQQQQLWSRGERSRHFQALAVGQRKRGGRQVALRREIQGLRPDQICAAGIGRTFQIVKPFAGLTVLDNVMVGAFLRSSTAGDARRVAADIVEKLGLGPKRDLPASSLTLPDRKRLEMASNQTYLKCRQRVLEFLYERHHFVEAA